MLAQGVARSTIVQAITASTEYRTKVVDRLYRDLLDRPADKSGLNTFVGALAAGASIEQVQAVLVGSTEYYQHAGGTDEKFLGNLYAKVLHRGIDTVGKATWTQALTNGLSRTTVGGFVITSAEAENNLVGEQYEGFLQRSADAAGLGGWLAARRQGLRREALVAGFLGSDEFFADL